MTGELWGRDWELTIGTTCITPRVGTPLDCAFEVEKSTGREPNTAKVRVFNLGAERRQGLSSGDQIELKAGYTGLVETLFVGDARRVYHERSGEDIVTTLEARDAGERYRTTRLDRGFTVNTPVITVVRAAVDAMGIGRGNLDTLASDLTIDNATAFAEGYTCDGPAWRVLDRLITSCGLRWSVQDGNLQLLRGREALATTAVRLASGTGLIGSPTRDAGAARGRAQRQTVNAVAQLIPGLYPGRPVVLESSSISGSYRIKRVRYVGDNSTNEWHAELTLEER